MEQLERIQTTALRIIFIVNLTDHIYCDNLRKKAKVETNKERLESSTQNPFKRAHFNSNELKEELIISFKQTSAHQKDNSDINCPANIKSPVDKKYKKTILDKIFTK